FHISELYSPWSTWAEMASNFLEAKKQPDTLKTFINTALGESWEESAERLDPHEIMDRAETYQTPNSVLVVTAAVDVQDDRLEAEVKGWGDEFESWSLDHHIIYGDPSRPEIWKRLDQYLSQTITRDDGQLMRISSVMIDSGGHHTDMVYRFCKPRYSRRIYAIKGKAGVRELVSRPTRNNRHKCPVFTLGVDHAKDLLFYRLQIERSGPGYLHFPEAYDREWFEQLTAEERREKHIQGRKVHYYHQKRARNEALDLNVYNLACVDLLAPQWDKLGRPKAKPKPEKEPTAIQRAVKQHRKRRTVKRSKWI
ncbi:MAG: terminase gpA endonuclease subunit, partial [Cyanobacteria bacterium J06555_12]